MPANSKTNLFTSGESISDGEVRSHLNDLINNTNQIAQVQSEQPAGIEITVTSQPSFWAKLTGTTGSYGNYSPSEGNTRDIKWYYSWEMWERTSATAFAKITVPASQGGTGAINSIEYNNDGSGRQGNSIDLGGFGFGTGGTSGVYLRYAQDGAIVRMWPEGVGGGTATVHTFEYVNNVDFDDNGDCV